MAEFDQLPAHLTEQLHLFSMDDLSRVKKGQLTVQAKAVLNSAIHHVENCEVSLKHCVGSFFFIWTELKLHRRGFYEQDTDQNMTSPLVSPALVWSIK